MDNTTTPSPIRKLYRSDDDRKVAGVCGGIAEYFDVDATLIRVVMVVLAVSGPGLLLYPALWLVVPPRPATPLSPPVAATPPTAPEATDPAA